MKSRRHGAGLQSRGHSARHSSGLQAEASSPLCPQRGMGLDPSGTTATFLWWWWFLALPVPIYTAASTNLMRVHVSPPAPPSTGYTYQ